jgi:hypothetical protein
VDLLIGKAEAWTRAMDLKVLGTESLGTYRMWSEEGVSVDLIANFPRKE